MPRIATVRRRDGFTLIELCFVTAIMSVLAAVATPSYTRYLFRAQAAEALAQVETMAYLEQLRILEVGAPIACGPEPTEIPVAAKSVLFHMDPCWNDLGFRVTGRVRFQYETRVGPDRSFEVFARGDLDHDGRVSEYRIASDTMELSRTNPD